MKAVLAESYEKIHKDHLIGIGIDASYDRGMSTEQLKELANNIMDSVEYLLPIFKNKGFSEEKEIRYVWKDDGSRKIYFREKMVLLFHMSNV